MALKTDWSSAEAVSEAYAGDIAALPEEAQAQVKATLEEAEAVGELDHIEMETLLVEAEAAEWRRDEAEASAERREEAIEDGDYDKAAEAAREVQNDLADARDLGQTLDKAEAQAADDTLTLEAAAWDQSIAEESLDAAALDADAPASSAAEAEDQGDRVEAELVEADEEEEDADDYADEAYRPDDENDLQHDHVYDGA